nr:PREDICTED: protein CLP1 homolog isoform X3 [Nicotiana tabacum]
MDGPTETDYTADETPMISYINVHAVLDGRRNRAKASPSDSDTSQGPRVVVVGPTDSGKSTLSRMLLSWAAKQGWKPTFVDLDIGQGSITIPGCVAATPIELPIDPVEGIPLEMPMVYFFGHVTPSANIDHYKVLVKELAQTLEKQFSGNAESRASGMVINTMGWIEGVGYELLLHAIDTFSATVILVLGQEKLCSMLKDVLKKRPNVDVVKLQKSGGVVSRNAKEKLCSMLKDVLKNRPNVDVVKLQKSGGVVSRNAKVRQKARGYRIREYFYGPSNDLSPHSNVVNFGDLFIYRIGGGPQAPRSALPIGAEPAADPTRLVSVSINRDLLHLVLAVSYANEPDQIISSNVAGFIYVTDVDMHRKKITYLAPCAGELPSKYLIVGTLTWIEN